MSEVDGRLVFADATPAVKAEDAGADTAAGKKPAALPRNVANGVSAKVDLSGLGTSKSIAVQGSYDISAGLVAALKSTLHPVRAARAAGQNNDRGQRGQGVFPQAPALGLQRHGPLELDHARNITRLCRAHSPVGRGHYFCSLPFSQGISGWTS